MIPWVQLDTAEIPAGGQLRLMRRGAEYSIMSGSIELMNSRLSGSEKALASLTCARIAGRREPHVLIGGLGMGFTLRAALAALPARARPSPSPSWSPRSSPGQARPHGRTNTSAASTTRGWRSARATWPSRSAPRAEPMTRSCWT